MTEAMPFLQKTILLSYDPRPFRRGVFYSENCLIFPGRSRKINLCFFTENTCTPVGDVL